MDVITVNTTLVAAEVYRRGCTLTYRGKAALEQGQNHVVVEGLPEGLDEGSISLKMPTGVEQGQVRIVRAGAYGREEGSERQLELSHQVDELDRKIDNRQLELDAWKELAAKMNGPAALDYLGRLPKTLDSLTAELAALRKERRTLAKERDELREHESRPRFEADLSVTQSGTLPFELTCRSDRAGWSPSYDVLVDALDAPLRLRLKGEVWQRTGEDWNDVTMRLSTGTSTVMGDLPRFYPRYLRREEEVRPAPKMRSNGLRPSMMASADMAMGDALAAPASLTVGDTFDFTGMSEVIAPAAEVSENATATTYELAQPQSLATTGESQTLVVSTEELAASYHFYAYPKKALAAYLVAHLDVEPSPEVLERPLSVYLEGSYAGSVRLGHASSDDGYELPLGTDERVRVRRTEDVHRAKRLLSNKVTLEHRCSITVENLKANDIELVVLEQVPVSRDKEIEVSLNEVLGTTFDKDRGELRWTCTLAAGARTQLEATYVVSHAQGVEVESSERW